MNRIIERRVTKRQQKIIREIIVSRVTINAQGCWITNPSRTGEPKNGRPSILKIFGILATAPVWSYLGWHNRKLQSGTAICHSCDTPRCANPEHIWLGNDSENAKDAYQKGRRKSPFVGHGPRAKHIELALGRRRILMRWHGSNWAEAYKKHYGKIPKYLEKHHAA